MFQTMYTCKFLVHIFCNYKQVQTHRIRVWLLLLRGTNNSVKDQTVPKQAQVQKAKSVPQELGKIATLTTLLTTKSLTTITNPTKLVHKVQCPL